MTGLGSSVGSSLVCQVQGCRFNSPAEDTGNGGEVNIAYMRRWDIKP